LTLSLLYFGQLAVRVTEALLCAGKQLTFHIPIIHIAGIADRCVGEDCQTAEDQHHRQNGAEGPRSSRYPHDADVDDSPDSGAICLFSPTVQTRESQQICLFTSIEFLEVEGCGGFVGWCLVKRG